MFETNLKSMEADLKETVSMFLTSEKLNIMHVFKETEEKFVNTITIDGKVFAYGNLVKKFSNEIEKKRYIKMYSKLALYKAISSVLNVKLPWGALTGIRPTKLAYSKLEEKIDYKEFLSDTMLVSDKKVALVKRIIDNQKGVYGKNSQNTDFFVFIPFCPSRCEYCSFITEDIKNAKNKITDYVTALIDEIRSSAKLIKNLRSIYIGGGTPIALPVHELKRLLSEIDKLNTGVEYTVEAGRPDVITEDVLKLLKDYGVTRICVNPQTFSDTTLKLIGRCHTKKETIHKYMLANDMFSINMDLIAGLPKETFADFKNSVDECLKLSPDAITVHTICVKRGSKLWSNVKKLSVENIEEMIDYSYVKLTENGYEPYYLYRQKYMAGNLENVGYAKKGRECIYNIDVMEEISQNIACGVGAVSKYVDFEKDKIIRYGNPKDISTYINKLEEIKKQKENFFAKK